MAYMHDMLDEGGCDNELMKGENVDPDEVKKNCIFAVILGGRH